MVLRAGVLRVHPSKSAIPGRGVCAPAVRIGCLGVVWVSLVIAVLLIGVGRAAPAEAQPAPVGPGPGLYTIRPLAHPDLVLTVDRGSSATVFEEDSGDPDQTIRVRPVRGSYNVFNQRNDEYLGYYRDGRTGWEEQIAEWQVLPVDGYGEGVYLIRVPDVDGPPAEALTYLGDDPAATGVRVVAAPGSAAYEAQLWKFERATGNRPYSGELETVAGP